MKELVEIMKIQKQFTTLLLAYAGQHLCDSPHLLQKQEVAVETFKNYQLNSKKKAQFRSKLLQERKQRISDAVKEFKEKHKAKKSASPEAETTTNGSGEGLHS